MATQRKMNETAYEVLALLGDKPKSKAYLAYASGLSERALRNVIRTLRENGYCVCSNSQAGGYWPGDEADIERTAGEMMRRGIALINQARTLHAHVGQIPGQIAFDLTTDEGGIIDG